jgi:hypothetical protein
VADLPPREIRLIAALAAAVARLAPEPVLDSGTAWCWVSLCLDLTPSRGPRGNAPGPAGGARPAPAGRHARMSTADARRTLDAAVATLRAHGIHGASATSIAARAGARRVRRSITSAPRSAGGACCARRPSAGATPGAHVSCRSRGSTRLYMGRVCPAPAPAQWEITASITGRTRASTWPRTGRGRRRAPTASTRGTAVRCDSAVSELSLLERPRRHRIHPIFGAAGRAPRVVREYPLTRLVCRGRASARVSCSWW